MVPAGSPGGLGDAPGREDLGEYLVATEQSEEGRSDVSEASDRSELQDYIDTVQSEGRSARNVVSWHIPFHTSPTPSSGVPRSPSSVRSDRSDRSDARRRRRKEEVEKPPSPVLSTRDTSDDEEDSGDFFDEDLDPREAFRLRVWGYLFRNVNRSVDELYSMCQAEACEKSCQAAVELMESCSRDFTNLLNSVAHQKRFETAAEEGSAPTAVAWEIRKSAPSQDVLRLLPGGGGDPPPLGLPPRAPSAPSSPAGGGGGGGDDNLSDSGDGEEFAAPAGAGLRVATSPPSGPVTWASMARDASSPPRRQRSLHAKLSSPDRYRRSPLETKRLHEERQSAAERNRERLFSSMQSKLALKASRIRDVSERHARKLVEAEESIRHKLGQAEERKEAHLHAIKCKASDENAKVDEVGFINSLTRENKVRAIEQRQDDVEARRLKRLEGIRQKAGNPERERAVKERKRAVDERKQQLHHEQRQQMGPGQLRRRRAEMFRTEGDESADAPTLDIPPRALDGKRRTTPGSSKGRRKHAAAAAPVAAPPLEKSGSSSSSSSSDDGLSDVEAPTPAPASPEVGAGAGVAADGDALLAPSTPPKQQPSQRRPGSTPRTPQSGPRVRRTPRSAEADDSGDWGAVVAAAAAAEGEEDASPATLARQEQVRAMQEHDRSLREKERAMKKKARRVRLRLENETPVYDEPADAAALIETLSDATRARLVRLVAQVIQLREGDPEVSESCLQELGRAVEGRSEAELTLLRRVGGLDALVAMCDKESAALRPKTVHLALAALTLSASLAANRDYLLASKALLPLSDLLVHCLATRDADATSMQLTAAALQLMTLQLRHRPLAHMEGVKADVLRLLQSSGAMLRLTGLYFELRQSLDERPGDALLPLLQHSLGFVEAITGQGLGPRVGMAAPRSEGPLLNVLRFTEVLGIVSLLLTLLFARAPQRHGEYVKVPAEMVVIAWKALKVLNNVARLDLAFVQALLTSDANHFEFHHMLDCLLKHATERLDEEGGRGAVMEEELLQELIVLIGFFAVGSPANRERLRWGTTPNVLQRLAALPFRYYSDPTYVDTLFPTLIAVCCDDDQNKAVVEADLNTALLARYVRQQIAARDEAGEAPASSTSSARRDYVLASWQRFSNRFPPEEWERAAAFLS